MPYLVLARPYTTYTTLSHSKEGCRLRLCWDRVLDPAAKHVQLDKRVRGAQANVNLTHLLKAEQEPDVAASSSDQDSDPQVPRILSAQLALDVQEGKATCRSWLSGFTISHAGGMRIVWSTLAHDETKLDDFDVTSLICVATGCLFADLQHGN